jgi:hypothetical protein
MLRHKCLMYALLALTMTACASPIQQRRVNWNDPQDITTWMTVTRDDYKKMTRVQGPTFGTEIASAMLRAWRLDGSSGSANYQIYVKSVYRGNHWRSYNDAYDADGQRLPLTKIVSDVRCYQYGCLYEEHVGLEVTEHYLREHTTNGIRVQVSGPGGEERLSLPPAYIAAILQKTAALQ